MTSNDVFPSRYLSGAIPNNHTETKNTYHRPDPAFTYLLSLFLTLTGLAWGLAYANSIGQTLQITLVFVIGHFLGLSLLTATATFFLVSRVFSKRRQGLFGPPGGEAEGLEFGYCFDVCLSLVIVVVALKVQFVQDFLTAILC